jgi:hypothetical protein
LIHRFTSLDILAHQIAQDMHTCRG